MQTTFREKIQPKTTQEIQQKPKVTPDVVPDDGTLSTDEKIRETIDLFETEKGHKLTEDIFDIREIIIEDKVVKMQSGMIDKHIKQTLEDWGWDKTTENYRAVLDKIESTIGSSQMELYKRLQKITGYIKVMNKLKKAKQLKKQYELFQNNI